MSDNEMPDEAPAVADMGNPKDDEPDDAAGDPVQELRELLAQMPLFDIESKATAAENAAERVVLDDWAAQTAAAARKAGRPDIELRVIEIMEYLDRVEKHAAEAAPRSHQARGGQTRRGRRARRAPRLVTDALTPPGYRFGHVGHTVDVVGHWPWSTI
ncbi:hypothetical protein [Mycobacterium sp. shizuoka-1]|uniref:hypothetical protein n=1 Tax=Mycobacterium sp. shizuoka-1 TaxID=2039281 RepID=UPI000C05E70D|nr:hypothetical protein [Mycobacterium sp. shizuoka-1]GAY16239.1 hypothetical protein MSZK_29650 [Mycobacterium sp. shizuoka-1]